jgi:hypothetical protein
VSIEPEQLSIWSLLERVSAEPLDANIIDLSNWIGSLQLESAGDALVAWGESYRDRAIRSLDEWRSKPSLLPLELVEPPYDRSIFDELVLGRMEWDLGELVETIDYYYPSERQAAPAIVSVTKDEALELANLQAALDIAHAENVSQWGGIVSARLQEYQQGVSLVELQKNIEMPLVQLWLGLLLNGFEVEQRGEFYALDGVWVLP